MIAEIKNITSIEDVIIEIDNFSKKTTFGIKSEDIRKIILNTFIKFSDVSSVSFFELNEEDFIFEHYKSYPENFDTTANSIFDELVETSVIGRFLQSGLPDIFPEYDDKNSQFNVVIVPLSSGEGIDGIILLNLSKHWGRDTSINLGLCRIFANSFSNMLTISRKERKINILEESFEQRLSERLIEHIKSKNELNTFLDALQTGIFISSLKTGKIFRVNPIAVELTGYNEFELSSMTIHDFMESTNNVMGEHYETFLLNKEGEKIPILRKNKIVEIRGTEYQVDSFLDITEIKEANETLMNYNKKLEENVNQRTYELQSMIERLNDEIKEREVAEKTAHKERSMNQLKSKFIATVSHEFRTPLTIIRTSADLLSTYSQRLSEDDKSKYLQRVVQTTDYLNLVLQNILYLQDQDNQLLGSSSFEANLKEILDELLIIFKYNSKVKGQFEFEISDNNITIFQSSGIIKTIFSNIIHNSVIYNKDNNIIKIKINHDKEFIYFEVEDQGIGIPEEDQETIFDLFTRGSNVGNIPGVGLGLPVVTHCLNITGGDVNIESTLGEGTNVKVRLPKAQS